jgi:hypothetical protein
MGVAGLPKMTWKEALTSEDPLVRSLVQALLDKRNVPMYATAMPATEEEQKRNE